MRPIVNTSLRLDEKSTSRYHFDLSSKTVVNGENVLLNCPVYGFPKPSIEWKKNGVRFDVILIFFINIIIIIFSPIEQIFYKMAT